MKKNIAKTHRYLVYQFDKTTFVVADSAKNCEICVCVNYGDREDAEQRAEKIAILLNKANKIS